MQAELKQHLSAQETWVRGLYILLFAVILAITRVVLWAVVVLQFLLVLFTGEPHARLQSFGASLAAFIYQAVVYVTFNSEERPFPFSAWPEGTSRA